ncbi:MAG TPA: M23 family metallopeptidase [Bacillota bacterium]|mgnify:CR=1 FL=1|nr:M23 family metallopeptidase [Bacillota bacterium]
MNRFVSFLVKLKWLGLIGLLGSITGSAYLKLFWLFFLLGLVEIFSNLSASRQSVKQLLSYPLIWFSHRFFLPSKENHAAGTEFILPFRGQWYVANGGADKKTSHSWHVWPQRYAYDFVMIDESGKTHSGSGRELQDYYCYGQDVLAPADGEVVSMADIHPESRVYGDGRIECRAKDIRGNYVTLKHNEKEFSTIAHLMPNSITVAMGQKVVRGQAIAKCGNSGNTSEPHVHFQLNDGKSFFASAGLPVKFKNVLATENGKTRLAEYIVKGQSVENCEFKLL